MTRDTSSDPLSADEGDGGREADKALARLRLAEIRRASEERARRIRDQQESGFSETPTGRFDDPPRGRPR